MYYYYHRRSCLSKKAFSTIAQKMYSATGTAAIIITSTISTVSTISTICVLQMLRCRWNMFLGLNPETALRFVLFS